MGRDRNGGREDKGGSVAPAAAQLDSFRHSFFDWSGRRDSNPRPPEPHSAKSPPATLYDVIRSRAIRREFAIESQDSLHSRFTHTCALIR